jgi:Family of unknown function (DUF5995)
VSVRELAELAGTTRPQDIPEVLRRLKAIEDCAIETSDRGKMDGIASFTRLYHVITDSIGKMERDRQFEAPNGFLARLDVEFAERYFEAIRSYATNPESTPGCWKVLFDRRDDDIPEANFAAAGVNAHINYDLSAALLRTWAHTDPDDEDRRRRQRRDYEKINDVFEAEMDGLREQLHTFLSEGPDGAIWDRGANWIGDLVVRWTRAMAWDQATEVWRTGDPRLAVARSDRRLGAMATTFGAIILKVPLPF